MVTEAVGAGIRIVPLARLEEHDTVVRIFMPRHPIDAGLRAAVDWLGESHDAGGLLATCSNSSPPR